MATFKEAARVIEVYPDAAGKYRWRAKARNGRVTAVSGESFSRPSKASRAALRECSAWQGAIAVYDHDPDAA